AQANLQRGHAYYWLGDYRRAVDVFTHNVTSLQGDLRYLRTPHVPAALSFGGLACAFAERGDFVEGIAAGHEAVRIAESVGNPFSLMSAYAWHGAAYLSKGDLEQAIPALEQSLAIYESRHIPLLFSVTAARL